MKTTTVYDGTWVIATFISRPQHDWLLTNYPLFFKDVMKNTNMKKWNLAGVTIDRNPEIEALLRGYVAPKRNESFRFI